MVSLIIRYVVSVIYYEPYIYGDPKAYVWYRGYVSFFLTMDTIYYLIKENLSILSNWAVNIFYSKTRYAFFHKFDISKRLSALAWQKRLDSNLLLFRDFYANWY